MAAPWILASKISPPDATEGFLPRELLPADAPPVALLVAGPGYGKTLGLVAIAERAKALGHATLWLSFDELDGDPVPIFQHLVAAMRAHVPPFGTETEALLGASHADLRVVWQVFFQELAGYNLPGLLICLDDLHHVARQVPDFVKTLAFFFERLPAGVRFAIASRESPAIPLARLVARGTAVVLGPERLRLSDAEAADLWRALGGGEPPANWPALTAAYEGWPLGVAFAASKAAGGSAAGGAPAGEVSAFIAAEFYHAQDPDLQALMLRAALLQSPSSEACAAVFDLADAAGRLERLEALHLVQRLADGSYRFPPYLRDFLATQAARTLPASELAAAHGRAGTFYLERDRPEIAFGHLIAARDWDRALATCRQVVPVLLARGRHGRLETWLEEFGAARGADPWLQFWWGQLAWRAGDAAQAGGHFERALEGFAAAGDRAGVAKATIRLLTIATNQEDAEAVERHGRDVDALARDGGDEDRADLALLRALEAEAAGDLAGWQQANERVLQLPIGTNIELAQCACIACMNLFTLEYHRGDWARARHHVEEAVAIARRWEFHPEELFASFMRAHVQLAEGEVEEAGAFLRALPDSWEDVLDWHDRACALTTVGAYHQARGDLKEAEQALARSAAVFEKAGFPLGKKVPVERQAWVALQRQQPARALALLADGGELARTSVHDLALRLVRARALDLAGEGRAAVAAFEELADDARAIGAPLPFTRARLYEAAARARSGDAAGARSALEAALAEVAARGYDFLRRQDTVLWQELAALAAPPERGAKAAAGPVELRLFGGLEARLEGVLLDHWPRRKTKVLLAALALAPRGLAAVQLAEVLGEREGKLDGVQACVASLRRALEPELKTAARSRFVPLEQDRYRLAEDRLGFCDVRAFEAAYAEAERRRDADPEGARAAYEEALAHYRGNLLDEPFFERYFEAEREGYRRQAIAALGWLVDRYVYTADEAAAARCLERAVALASCDEEVAIRVLKHHGTRRSGERVRHAYWDYRKALHRRLGLVPSGEVEAAYLAALKLAGG